MRGDDRRSYTMFSYVAPEQRVPADHPLRAIRTMVDTALRELSPEFGRLYRRRGVRRSRLRSCSAPCWCRCCTPSGASAN
jgi:hypothetical protein